MDFKCQKVAFYGRKTKKNQKTQKNSKFWIFLPKMRFFGFFHFLKLKGHRNRMEEVRRLKIDGCYGKMANIYENAKKVIKKW